MLCHQHIVTIPSPRLSLFGVRLRSRMRGGKQWNRCPMKSLWYCPLSVSLNRDWKELITYENLCSTWTAPTKLELLCINQASRKLPPKASSLSLGAVANSAFSMQMPQEEQSRKFASPMIRLNYCGVLFWRKMYFHLIQCLSTGNGSLPMTDCIALPWSKFSPSDPWIVLWSFFNSSWGLCIGRENLLTKRVATTAVTVLYSIYLSKELYSRLLS